MFWLLFISLSLAVIHTHPPGQAPKKMMKDVLLVASICQMALAFQSPSPYSLSSLSAIHNNVRNIHPNNLLHQNTNVKSQLQSPSSTRAIVVCWSSGGSDNSDGSTTPQRRRKKRVKRKESTTASASAEEEEEEELEEDEEEEVALIQVPELKPREDTAVNLQVQDIRNLVGAGSTTSSASSSSGRQETTLASSMQSSSSTASKTGPKDKRGGVGSMDSLEMLLQDAKELKALEDKKQESGSSLGSDSEDGGFSVPDTFRNILSTIVTADFFVVCGFLLWFLAGIFCSYILKDDTVQIAFNQLFQPVVQPALGILMIGAIAGSFMGNDEEAD